MNNNKKMEELSSKKFDVSKTERVLGGEGPGAGTSYGPDKQTYNGHESGYDCHRVTYNPPGYPGTQGWDVCLPTD